MEKDIGIVHHLYLITLMVQSVNGIPILRKGMHSID